VKLKVHNINMIEWWRFCLLFRMFGHWLWPSTSCFTPPSGAVLILGDVSWHGIVRKSGPGLYVSLALKVSECRDNAAKSMRWPYKLDLKLYALFSEFLRLK
jgi:hypothetical protein